MDALTHLRQTSPMSLVLSHTIIGTPILSLQTGAPVGSALEPIIDPRQLTIIGYYVQNPRGETEPTVLLCKDIRELSATGIIVDASDEIVPLSELVNVQKVVDFGFALIGTKVIDENKKKLGKVADYSLDINTFAVVQLNVKRPLLASLSDSELLIHRKQIVQVRNEFIMVQSVSLAASQQASAPQLGKPLLNPFRKPQPETSISADD